jgi:hypothetical protein
MLVEILIPIVSMLSIFGTIFGTLYIFLTTRNRERMAMIEKGADPTIFAGQKSRIGIKIGLLAIGVALGVLFGQLIAHTTSMDLEPSTFSMIFLCAGAGLVFDHYLAKKESKENV